MAAAGLYALENTRERLVEDHKKAKEFSVGLHELPPSSTVENVDTNIAILSLQTDKEAEVSLITSNNSVKLVHAQANGYGTH